MFGMHRGQLPVESRERAGARRRRWMLALLAVAAAAVALPASADAIVDGHISGKVTAATGGEAIVGLYVCADATVGEAYACGDTGAKGVYDFELPEGEYNVEFYDETCEHTCQPLDYLSQYWKDAANYQGSEPVVVKAGKTTENINASMITAGTFEGHVTNSKGEPVESDEVCAYTEEGEEIERCGETEEEGYYSIPGLPTAHYTIEFDSTRNLVEQYYPGVRTYEAATKVEAVDGAEKHGLDAELKEGAKIEGLVTGAGAPVGEEEVCPRPLAGAAFANCAYTNLEGKYTLEALEGEYGVAFAGNGSTLGPELYENATSEATEKHIKTTAGTTVKGIDGNLPTSGEITGTVTAAPAGSPVAGVDVCAYSEIDFESCARTNASGVYTIKGVAGGYHVEFYGEESCNPGCVSLPYTDQYYNGTPSYLRAQLISVGAGQLVSGVNARLAKTNAQVEEETENRKIAEAVAKQHAEELLLQEAAATKHAQEVKAAEEAAKRKAAEEHIHAEAAAVASFKIVHFKSTATMLLLTLKLPRAETLTLGGSGIKRAVVHVAKGTHVVKLRLTPTGRTARKHNRKITLSIGVEEGTILIVLEKQLKL